MHIINNDLVSACMIILAGVVLSILESVPNWFSPPHSRQRGKVDNEFDKGGGRPFFLKFRWGFRRAQHASDSFRIRVRQRHAGNFRILGTSWKRPSLLKSSCNSLSPQLAAVAVISNKFQQFQQFLYSMTSLVRPYFCRLFEWWKHFLQFYSLLLAPISNNLNPSNSIFSPPAPILVNGS